jgi:hypothetical protein
MTVKELYDELEKLIKQGHGSVEVAYRDSYEITFVEYISNKSLILDTEYLFEVVYLA